MKPKLIIFLFLLLCKLINPNKLLPKFLPISLIGCEDNDGNTNMEYRDPGNGKKAWIGNMTIPITIDPNTEFSWELRWWKNGDWEKEKQTFKGKACYYLQKFGAKAWEQMRLGAKPPISECPIKPGTHNFNNFEVDYSDVHLPIYEKGRWSGKIVIKKENKIFCVTLIAEMS